MARRCRFTLVAICLVLVLAPAAYAGLVGHGPIRPLTENGFPQWYKDANGVILDLPYPPPLPGDAKTPPTMIFDPVVASNPYSVQVGFGTEAFYWMARAFPNTRYGKGIATFGLEASFANLTAKAGDQVVFARIRLKAPVKVAGTYYFYHPYGTETIMVTDADIKAGKAIFFTKDYGVTPGWVPNPAGGFILAPPPGGFDTVLSGPIGPFLRPTALAPGVDPALWFGDGVTLTTVTGSLLPATDKGFNKVRLEGPDPNLDGQNHNFVETTLFTVSGHKAQNPQTPAPLTIDRATCSVLADAGGVLQEYDDVFVSCVAGLNLSVTGTTFAGSVPMTGASGKYYAHIGPVTGPGTVTVLAHDPAAVFTDTTAAKPVVDFVNILSATYDSTIVGGTLTITATSSYFTSVGLLFTVSGFLPPNTFPISDFVNGTGSIAITGVAVPPPNVTVNSSLGGSDTQPIQIIK